MSMADSIREVFEEENRRNQQFRSILLEAVQKSLLIQLVKKVRSIPRDKLRKFIIIRAVQGDLIACPDSKDIEAYIGDIETLGREGLIALSSNLRAFDITPFGLAYCDYLKETGQIEKISSELQNDFKDEQRKKPLHKTNKQEAKNEVNDSHFIKAGENISAGGDIIVGNENIKKQDIPTKKKEEWYQTNTFKGAVIALVVALLGGGIPAWLSLSNKTDHSLTASTNIFAYVSKDGAILQSKNFPWKISKSKDEEDGVTYIINDRYGDSSAVSVFPDNSRNEYTVYNAIDGVAVKFTCPEEEISNFTIKLKY